MEKLGAKAIYYKFTSRLQISNLNLIGDTQIHFSIYQVQELNYNWAKHPIHMQLANKMGVEVASTVLLLASL